jgi:hypothetical protein
MNKIISNDEMLTLLKLKYPKKNEAYDKAVSNRILDVQQWIELFDSLNKLKIICKNDVVLEGCDSESKVELMALIQKLLTFTYHAGKDVFSSKYKVTFELLYIYKLSLDAFCEQDSEGNALFFFQRFSLYIENGEEVPPQFYLQFYSTFKRFLASKTQTLRWIIFNQKRLAEARQEIVAFYRRYAGLYVLNVAYHLELTSEMSSRAEIIHQFNELFVIEKQIASDQGLLKVLFNFEYDGIRGCLLNCILIYPLHCHSNENKILEQLEVLAENCIEGKVKFIDNHLMFKKVCGEDVLGKIDQAHKFENFLYWSVGSFHRYEDFFHYSYPSIFNVEINHAYVLKPWTLSLKPIQTGFIHRLVKIDPSELFNMIKDSEDVWSINTLDKVLQKKLMVDKVILLEMIYEFEHVRNLNGEILYFAQVFDKFLNYGREPFFYYDQSKGFICSMQPSRLGRQLIYLINLLSHQPDIINEIRAIAFLINSGLHSLFRSPLWANIENLAKQGSHVLTDVETLIILNGLRGHYRPDQLGAKSLTLPSLFSRYSPEDFSLFHRRNRDAIKYVDELLKEDLLICRLKFYADVEGETFLDQKEIFSKYFTEFIRVQKRTDLLKVLKGYFLVWEVEFPLSWLEMEKMKKPYVDIIFLLEPNYSLDVQEFLQALNKKWRDFQGKISATAEVEVVFKTRELVCDVVMHSDELLNLNYIYFEKRNRKLKKLLLEKLVPYFTFRHFYYPKLYDDQVHKKVKMFSKGQ